MGIDGIKMVLGPARDKTRIIYFLTFSIELNISSNCWASSWSLVPSLRSSLLIPRFLDFLADFGTFDFMVKLDLMRIQFIRETTYS